MIHLDDTIAGCQNFKWKEFLFLESFDIHAYPKYEVIGNLIKTAQKMELIRSILGNEPLKITSGWRPYAYNRLIKGAPQSAHVQGLACDFQHASKDADTCRFILMAHLENLKVRMEDLPYSNWVHIDLRETSGERFFKP